MKLSRLESNRVRSSFGAARRRLFFPHPSGRRNPAITSMVKGETMFWASCCSLRSDSPAVGGATTLEVIGTRTFSSVFPRPANLFHPNGCAHPWVYAALELVQAWSEIRQRDRRAGCQGDCILATLRRWGKSDVERWHNSTPEVYDFGKSMAPSTSVPHVYRLASFDGYVRGFVPPGRVANEELISRNRKWRPKQCVKLCHRDVPLGRLESAPASGVPSRVSRQTVVHNRNVVVVTIYLCRRDEISDHPKRNQQQGERR